MVGFVRTGLRDQLFHFTGRDRADGRKIHSPEAGVTCSEESAAGGSVEGKSSGAATVAGFAEASTAVIAWVCASSRAPRAEALKSMIIRAPRPSESRSGLYAAISRATKRLCFAKTSSACRTSARVKPPAPGKSVA